MVSLAFLIDVDAVVRALGEISCAGRVTAETQGSNRLGGGERVRAPYSRPCVTGCVGQDSR